MFDEGTVGKYKSRIVTMYEYQENLRTLNTTPLVPGLLWPGSVTLMVAETSSGKSTLVCRWGFLFSQGEPWLDVGPLRPLRVAYLDLENPAPAQKMLAEYMTAEPEQPWVTVDGSIAPSEMTQALIDLCRGRDVLVLDNLQHAYPVNDEQDNATAIVQMQSLMKVTKETNVAILVTFNSGKQGEQTPMQRASWPHYARGASSRVDLADAVVNLVNEEIDNECAPEDGRYLLYVAKSRFGNRGEFWRYTYAGDLDYALAEHRQPGGGRGSTNVSGILKLLRDNPDGLSTSEIADKVDINRTTALRNLKKLEVLGTVQFVAENPNDPAARWLLMHGVKSGASVDS